MIVSRPRATGEGQKANTEGKTTYLMKGYFYGVKFVTIAFFWNGFRSV